MKRVNIIVVAMLALFFTGCASIGSIGSSVYVPTVAEAVPEGFGNPLKGQKFYLTSQFGPRIDPISYVASNHNGIDLAATTGTPVYAVMSGLVEVAGWHSRYGNYVIIKHDNGYKTLYAHMSKICTTKGVKIEQGEKLGEVGTTGYSTGPHLHYTVYKGSNLVDGLTLSLKNEDIDVMVYPQRKVGKMRFINSTRFAIKKYPVMAFDLDIYFVVLNKEINKNAIVNYSVYFDPDHANSKPFYLAFECGEERYEFKDINILYSEKMDNGGLNVSFTSTLSNAQITKLFSKCVDNKVYLILKYGDEPEQKLLSKEFNQKFCDAKTGWK